MASFPQTLWSGRCGVLGELRLRPSQLPQALALLSQAALVHMSPHHRTLQASGSHSDPVSFKDLLALRSLLFSSFVWKFWQMQVGRESVRTILACRPATFRHACTNA